MNDEWVRARGGWEECEGLAPAFVGGLMNISLAIQGGGSQMRNTLYGTTREGNWYEGQCLQVAFAGVPAYVGRLWGFVHCG